MRNTTVISVVSTKGGSGKTTTAANLGGLVAALGQRVLLIDADMQPSLTKFYKLAHAPRSGLNEVISRGGLIKAEDITPTTRERLDIIASNMGDHIQAWLKEREDRLIMLKRAVRQSIVRDNYDVVIIDTQGAKGELQRTAAMAADLMLTPLRPDMLNYAEFFSGTLEMLASLNVMADLVPEMKAGQLAIYINCMTRTTNARLVEEEIRSQFRTHPTIRLLDTKIPDATAYQSARTLQMPVHEIDPSKGRGNSACELMHALAFEVLPHLKGLWADGSQSQTRASREASEHAELGGAQ